MKSGKQGNKDGNIITVVRELISAKIEELGYRIWDVEFVKEGASYYLRVTIDNDEGITIDDCEKVDRAIDPMLNEADPIQQSYILEVSSPGIERELKSREHIKACEGMNVEVRLFAPMNGDKVFRGILRGMSDDGIYFEIEQNGGKRLSFPVSAVAKLCTVYDFGEI